MRLQEHETLAVILLVAGLVALLLLLPGLFNAPAPPLQIGFGWGAFVIAAALLSGGLSLYLAPKMKARVAPELDRYLAHQDGWPFALKLPKTGWRAVVLGELLLILLLVLTHLATGLSAETALAGRGGGLAGWAIGTLLTELVGKIATWGIVLAGSLLALFFLGREFLKLSIDLPDRSWGIEMLAWLAKTLGKTLRSMLPRPEGTEEHIAPAAAAEGGDEREAVVSDDSAVAAGAATTRSAGKRASRSKPPRQASTKERSARARQRPDTLPPLELLHPSQEATGRTADVRLRAQTLKQTLAEFGVPVEVVSIKEGPTVTQFGLEPGEVVRELRNGEVQRRRVSVHSILRLSNDLALALAASSIRIEAPVPGRPYVGVEIPNEAKTLVSLRSVLESDEFARVTSPLAVALGRDVSGDAVVLDLAALPHLLIAGATGSGKSVCINSIVCSLLMSNDPVTVRLVMVDPKMVELPAYNGVPHLVGEVITDPTQVPAALAWLTLQMDERYRVFADRGVRNIAGYNRKAAKSRRMEPLPYLVLVVDELADLMMSTAFDIERQICRLAQLSRATGIHLVLATQRPSVDVITGLIKANFPARIAFAVTTQIDSRVILDSPGAERLLGRGDMLYMAPDSPKLARTQGCFVADREIDAVAEFWKSNFEGENLEGPTPAPWTELLEPTSEQDALLEQAIEFLRGKTQVSTSLLQRQLRIGFPRAARLMEQLEDMGAVGPDEGGGRSRKVMEIS